VPIAEKTSEALLPIAEATTWPDLRRFIARRLTEEIATKPAPLETLLAATGKEPEARMEDVLAGMSEALAGWRKAPKPAAWEAFQAKLATATDPVLQERGRELSALFGDGRALDEIKRVALDEKAEMSAREAALRVLIDSRPDDLRSICEKLLDVRHLNAVAARGLALFDDPQIGVKLAKAYRRFTANARPAVLETLISRPPFAKALLENIGETRIPRSDITAFHARQIRSFADADLARKLAEVWGEVHESGADKTKEIAELKAKLTPDVLARADLSQGRVQAQVCTTCHTLYGEGGKVGPDLTGSGRADLGYLLENIVDPSGVVPPEYRMSVLTLKDGRVLTGIVAAQNERALTLRSITDAQAIERSEIAKQEDLPVSMMPEGMLQALDETQQRDLIAYLLHPTQVRLPAAGK